MNTRTHTSLNAMARPGIPGALIATLLLLPTAAPAQAPVTVGPQGEPATAAATLELTEEEVAQVRDGGHTAAFAWHELYDWSSAVAFRGQAFVTRAYVVEIAGVASGDPRVTTIENTLGQPAPWPALA